MTATLRHYATVLFLLCSLPGITLGREPEPNYALFTGTYSSFEYNAEAGDLNGVEVHILFTDKGLKAVVQFADGGAGDVALVNVTATGTQLHFEMPAGFDHEGRFDGTVSAKGLDGTFTYKVGRPEHLVLPRTLGYWDKPKQPLAGGPVHTPAMEPGRGPAISCERRYAGGFRQAALADEARVAGARSKARGSSPSFG